MIKEVGEFTFETFLSGGKVNKHILKLLQNDGYEIQKITDRKYRIFMKEEEESEDDFAVCLRQSLFFFNKFLYAGNRQCLLCLVEAEGGQTCH